MQKSKKIAISGNNQFLGKAIAREIAEKNAKPKNITVKAKSQFELAKGFALKFAKGEDVPIIHFKNTNRLFEQLDKDKTLTVSEKKRILSYILKNNERKIEQSKIEIAKEKELLKTRKKHNWDGGYQHKHSLSEFENLRKQVVAANTQKAKAKTELDNAYNQRTFVCNDANNCRPTWVKRCGQKRGACGWWTDTGIPRRQKAYSDAQKKYTELYGRLKAWEEEDDRFVAQQKADAEEARQRQEELRKQEKQEADLKASGLSLQELKLQISKQAAEIQKIDAEKKKLEEEKQKIKSSKMFGANVVNNIKDNKGMYIMIASFILLLIGGGTFLYFNNKNKK